MEGKNIIIEKTYKLSYLYTLLLGMFYYNSYIQDILNTDVYNNNGIYLQQLLKNLVFNYIRTNKIITNKQLNQIRLFIYISRNKTTNLLLEEENMLIKLYDYISDTLEIAKIQFIDKCYNIQKQIKYITIIVDKPMCIKTGINNWENNNNVQIVSLPKFIMIHINRINNNMCDINEYIKIIKDNDIYVYRIHSLIYKTIGNDMYNVLLNIENNWLLLDDHINKSLISINIKDKTNIKKTTEILFYCLVEIIN